MASPSKVTAWSFSRYSDYEQCPFKFKQKHIERIKEPPNEAMERGSKIGKLAEQFLKGDLTKFPPELKLFKEEFTQGKKLVKKRLVMTVVEDSWAFTKTWAQTKWDDWVNCWLRVKLDYAYSVDNKTMTIIDWKTGKFRPDNKDSYLKQLELYALSALILYPHIERVEVRLCYLDYGITYPDPTKADEKRFYTQADVPSLKKSWLARIKPMMSDTIFAPKPNQFCSWCHYRASNKEKGGGQCKF